jgi:hypothetical protein
MKQIIIHKTSYTKAIVIPGRHYTVVKKIQKGTNPIGYDFIAENGYVFHINTSVNIIEDYNKLKCNNIEMR